MSEGAGGGPQAAVGVETLPDAAGGPFWRLLPAAWRPFAQLARVDRPIGWWLLLLPGWWSIALAGIERRAWPDVTHLILFFVGAIAMRGAGSTYNDLVDRKIDALVERTRDRPLPSGRVSPRAAKLFLVVQALVGALVLVTFNLFTIVLGIGSLLIIAIYPFMKRITSWPQAVLGLAFAWGALMGWAASFGSLGLPAYCLYASAVFWIMGYDTIYALQDSRDDAIAGVRSTARLFGSKVRDGVGFLYLASVACAFVAVLTAGGGILANLGVLVFAVHLVWQLRRVDPADPSGALLLFRSNRDAGLLLFAALACDAVAASYGFL